MAGMAVFFTWLAIQNVEGKTCSDEKTLPVTWSGRKTHPTILPRSGIELTTSRTP